MGGLLRARIVRRNITRRVDFAVAKSYRGASAPDSAPPRPRPALARPSRRSPASGAASPAGAVRPAPGRSRSSSSDRRSGRTRASATSSGAGHLRPPGRAGSASKVSRSLSGSQTSAWAAGLLPAQRRQGLDDAVVVVRAARTADRSAPAPRPSAGHSRHRRRIAVGAEGPHRRAAALQRAAQGRVLLGPQLAGDIAVAAAAAPRRSARASPDSAASARRRSAPSPPCAAASSRRRRVARGPSAARPRPRPRPTAAPRRRPGRRARAPRGCRSPSAARRPWSVRPAGRKQRGVLHQVGEVPGVEGVAIVQGDPRAARGTGAAIPRCAPSPCRGPVQRAGMPTDLQRRTAAGGLSYVSDQDPGIRREGRPQPRLQLS